MSQLLGLSLDELVTKKATSVALDPNALAIFGATRYLPICPEDRLYLNVRGHGDDARFADRFRDAWDRIPREDSLRMVAHWKPHERIPGVLGIGIMLENLGSLRSMKRTAVCGGMGTELKFYAPIVDQMPPKHVAALVAHELAHVYQASTETLAPVKRPDFF